MVRLHFYRPTSLLGRLICWITKKDFSHVAIEHAWGGITFMSTAVEPQGVIGMRLAATKPGERIIELGWISDERWVFEWLSGKWGMQYGWRDLFLFPFKRREWRTNYSGYICSEYALLFLDAAIKEATRNNAVPTDWRINARLIGGAVSNNPSKVSPGGLFKLVTAVHVQ